MTVVNSDGMAVPFDWAKIDNAVTKAFMSVGKMPTEDELQSIKDELYIENLITSEELQDQIEMTLFDLGFNDVGRSYILYREEHKGTKFIQDRIDYMDRYVNSGDNASASSETDSNANVTQKNVANLEGEVYKVHNRRIQRRRMRKKLRVMFPEVYKQYEKDLEHHIFYTHDEASTPVLKQYCMAVSLYPLMTQGVGNIDGVTPGAPNDLQSFAGQLSNLIFLLSSQCKGAVAVGEFLIALNYYAILEFGENYRSIVDQSATTPLCKQQRTVKDMIIKAFKQFVWTINQPAGNRGYQSPFTNISYYDKTYFNSLFKDFYYPDGSQPVWEDIDYLQRLFIHWFNDLRLKQVLTFPVETFAMVHDGTDIIDKDYKKLCAEMYSQGHSFFTYISDSADSLASCCRLRNELAENTFSPTSGLTGVMTGSCNVITLNVNRIVQDWFRTIPNYTDHVGALGTCAAPYEFMEDLLQTSFKSYLIDLLERVYKYHIAFKTMLYEVEDKGMFAASNGGYIHISKLFSTVGINGLNEAARFLGLTVSNNAEYIKFLQLVLGTIKEQNKIHSIHDKKRPFLFNSEVVPAEGLGSKNYNWDKKDG